jgi:hypothetical protein
MEKGVIDVILKAMTRHERSADVCEAGCGAFWNLTASDDNEVRLMEKGIADVIMKAMTIHEDNVDICEAGFGALRNLSINYEVKIELMKRGIIDVVIMGLTKHEGNDNVNKLGCAMLANLVDNEEKSHAELMGKGVGELVVKAMIRHAGREKMTKNACRVLKNLMRERDNCVVLYRHGVRAVLENARKNYPENDDIRTLVKKCLARLHDAMPLVNKCTLNSPGYAVKALGGAIRMHHTENVLILCEYLIAQPDANLSNEENGKTIEIIGNGLKMFTESDNSTVVTHLLMILKKLSGIQVNLLINQASYVVAAMAKFHSDAQIAKLGTEILRNLATDPSNHASLRNIGAVKALEAAIKRHKCAEGILNKASETLEMLEPSFNIFSILQPLNPSPVVIPSEISNDLGRLIALFSTFKEMEHMRELDVDQANLKLFLEQYETLLNQQALAIGRDAHAALKSEEDLEITKKDICEGEKYLGAK